MRKFFIILNFFLFSVFLSSFSNAEECDFYDLKIGDSSVKAKNIFGEIKNEDLDIGINYIETSFSFFK